MRRVAAQVTCLVRIISVFWFVVFGLLAPSEQHRREKAGDDDRDGKLDEGVRLLRV
jgi:hypothetical protein